MKKYLIFLLSIVSFLGINTVSAEEIKFNYEDDVSTIQSKIELIGIDLVKQEINYLIETYNLDYKDEYPYFYISLDYNSNVDRFYIQLTYFKNFSHNDYFKNYYSSASCGLVLDYDDEGAIFSTIIVSSKEITRDTTNLGISLFCYGSRSLFPYSYYYSNFDFIFRGSTYTNNILNSDWKLSFLPTDNLLFQSYDDPSLYFVHKANEDFLIEPYYLYDNYLSMDFEDEIYTTINLNDYSYVALSLKDYNTIPDNNYSTFASFYLKGQVCITPVYNYGMTERKDILTGSQIQGCSKYYDDFTLTRMYILKDDVKNNAIYYLKPYDLSKENIIKINTSLFNITYITEENKDAPEILVNGKYYLSIPYDNLTDSATISEELGYISGSSCSVGDFNCYNEFNTSNMFNDVFDKPLETLKTVWSAIISIFALIAEFIALLPPVMQAFLLLSFSVGIALGIIKIIL